MTGSTGPQAAAARVETWLEQWRPDRHQTYDLARSDLRELIATTRATETTVGRLSTALDVLDHLLSLFPAVEVEGQAKLQTDPVRDSWVKHWRDVAAELRAGSAPPPRIVSMRSGEAVREDR